jgi:DNA-binding response OmpR family regulator
MKKILIVDDEPFIRELIAVTLSFDPYHLLEATNATDAIALALCEKPELIVLDVMLEGSEMDGLEVCRRLKTNNTTRHTFVIMLTAKGQKRDKEQGFAVGANDYLVKPFSPIELMTKVDRALNASPAYNLTKAIS